MARSARWFRARAGAHSQSHCLRRSRVLRGVGVQERRLLARLHPWHHGRVHGRRRLFVAAPCTRDEACGPDLSCWSATTRGLFSIAGGAAGGYCTRTCRADGDCSSLDPAAGCLLNQAVIPICARRCLTRSPRAGEQKCLDRSDLGCYSLGVEPQTFDPLGRQEGACSPVCGTDAECPGGFCDPLTRICIDTRRFGAGVWRRGGRRALSRTMRREQRLHPPGRRLPAQPPSASAGRLLRLPAPGEPGRWRGAVNGMPRGSAKRGAPARQYVPAELTGRVARRDYCLQLLIAIASTNAKGPRRNRQRRARDVLGEPTVCGLAPELDGDLPEGHAMALCARGVVEHRARIPAARGGPTSPRRPSARGAGSGASDEAERSSTPPVSDGAATLRPSQPDDLQGKRDDPELKERPARGSLAAW